MSFEQIVTQLPGQINIILILCLMAIGYVIKHTTIFAKVSNHLIPIVVVVVSLAITIITGDLTSTDGAVQAIMTGFINAALAVWAHETGKNVFEMLGTHKKPSDDETA